VSQANVFEQMIKLVSRHEFESAVSHFEGDRGTRRLDCWTWFGGLLFGQLTGHDSIRAIERVFCQGNRRMRGLGFSTVCRSTLADANRTRPLGVLEKTYQAVLATAKRQCPIRHGFRFHGEVRALDSTTIDRPGESVPPTMLTISKQAGSFLGLVASLRDCYVAA